MRNRETDPIEPGVIEFGEFKVGSQITWVDEKSKSFFIKPSYGYGEGPFELIKIKLAKAWNGHVAADPNKKPYTSNVLLTILTPKGEKQISADYFAPLKAR